MWQHFYETHLDRNFEFVSVALEHAGSEAASAFVERAHATFPTVLDQHGATAQAFGFKAVPNGVLVDATGIIRWTKFGGFSVDKPDDVATVERFLTGEEIEAPLARESAYELGENERELVATKLRLGHLLHAHGKTPEAVQEWTDALRHDPENLVIRKQIWAAVHPEKFYPVINWEWQRGQLAREREAEIAAGICGPDGCPLPSTM